MKKFAQLLSGARNNEPNATKSNGTRLGCRCFLQVFAGEEESQKQTKCRYINTKLKDRQKQLHNINQKTGAKHGYKF
jgi:hypothetical protein